MVLVSVIFFALVLTTKRNYTRFWVSKVVCFGCSLSHFPRCSFVSATIVTWFKLQKIASFVFNSFLSISFEAKFVLFHLYLVILVKERV